MNEVSSRLVEEVFPHVPVRQWVISFPFSVRYALAYNPLLVTKVLSIFMRIVGNFYAKAARKKGIDGKTGAVTFVQRSGSQINANLHLHSLFIDGVYSVDGDGKASFFPVIPPTDEEIVVLVRRICLRVTRFLEKKGYELNDFSDDPFAHEQPAFASILGASVQSRIALGERAGMRVRRVGEGIKLGDAYLVGRRCALCNGFSLHANTQFKPMIERPWKNSSATPPVDLSPLSA